MTEKTGTRPVDLIQQTAERCGRPLDPDTVNLIEQMAERCGCPWDPDTARLAEDKNLGALNLPPPSSCDARLMPAPDAVRQLLGDVTPGYLRDGTWRPVEVLGWHDCTGQAVRVADGDEEVALDVVRLAEDARRRPRRFFRVFAPLRRDDDPAGALLGLVSEPGLRRALAEAVRDASPPEEQQVEVADALEAARTIVGRIGGRPALTAVWVATEEEVMRIEGARVAGDDRPWWAIGGAEVWVEADGRAQVVLGDAGA